jgi:predicted O-methyltransferase YrrM
MTRGSRRKVPLGAAFDTFRRMLVRPERVRVIYDKDGHLLNPRPPDYVYAPVEAVLAAGREAAAALIEELDPYLCSAHLDGVSDEPAGPRAPYWRNGFFSFTDARVAYALVAARRPARIVEIGSGNSTRFFRKAIDDHGVGCTLTSIDPAPRADIDGISDEVLKANLLEVEGELFEDLSAGDFLFLDGSHLAFNGTDTTRFFLEILPALASGVLVHAHDIFLPYEYSELFTERLYNEQYLLACTILDTHKWRPLLPVHYLERQGFFADLAVPGAVNTSFWMMRT